MAAAVHRSVVAKLRQSTRFRSDTDGPSVLVRSARVLDQLRCRYGRPSPQGLLIDICLTQAELAALCRHGLVLTGYRQLLLTDPGALRDLVAKAEG